MNTMDIRRIFLLLLTPTIVFGCRNADNELIDNNPVVENNVNTEEDSWLANNPEWVYAEHWWNVFDDSDVSEGNSRTSETRNTVASRERWDTIRFYIKDRVKIEGKNYYRLFMDKSSRKANSNETLRIESNKFVMSIREKNHCIYALTKDLKEYQYTNKPIQYITEGSDCIIYDFNLEKGYQQTVNDPNTSDSENADYLVFQIKDITTYTLLNGKNIMRQIIWGGDEILEDIGSVKELFYNPHPCWDVLPTDGTQYERHLESFSLNGETLYNNKF